MQVIFGRRLEVFGTTKLEEIINRHWIKFTITNLFSYFFLFIYFGMLGVV